MLRGLPVSGPRGGEPSLPADAELHGGGRQPGTGRARRAPPLDDETALGELGELGAPREPMDCR